MATTAGGSPAASADDELPPSTAIVEAVSTSADTPAVELPPLYEVVDPDALDALFADGQTFGVVTFEYAGYDVTVRADGHVEVSQIE
ncbi:hypothetical protein IL252_07400 [Halomicrobium sp. IBSBa]|uniref:HalOD1 output domain-containing protein n=1 Tax=Halomicrobium sp. IBSBa TaxID=2778916 RepID=UPI001ABF45A9|nr:HalOD1 output domain-containing protein [Halomicrobium sp. IBSBa]MBO4247640.1 hypothetical protein [Halomicrobium sp. IBSBa]